MTFSTYSGTPSENSERGYTIGSRLMNVDHPQPFTAMMLPLLYHPDYCYNTHCICCLSCSCPCQAPRVYPLPARTPRRLGGGRRLAVTVTSLAGGHRGPRLAHCFDLTDLLVFSCSFARPMLDLHAFRRRHPTNTGFKVDGHAYFRPTTLDRCLDTLSNYGSGRETCTAKVFSPRLGVLSGFVFQRRSPGDTTLSEPRQTRWYP
jgi:hypothetical protein